MVSQICPIGTFAIEGASSCQNCTAGEYSIQAGTEICGLCPLGTYVDVTGEPGDSVALALLLVHTSISINASISTARK